MNKIFLILAVLLFSLPIIVSAATINAASCSQSSVQAAVNSASDGDTVVIPAGTCTWGASLNLDLSAPKALTIIGAGIGSTIINDYGFDVTGGNGKPWRISGMTMTGSAGVSVDGFSKNWRIDHIYFDHITGKASASGRVIFVQPTGSGTPDFTAGVIDHCTFDTPSSTSIHIRDFWASGGNSVWNRPLGLGTSDAVFIEDCKFINPGNAVTDCEGGSYVFRYNQVTNGFVSSHDAIVTNLRACRKWEVYNNLFINTPGQTCTDIRLRGGTGVIFSNRIQGQPDCGNAIQLQHYRCDQTGGDPWTTLCSSTSGKACLGSANTYPRTCSSDADCNGISGACINIDNPNDPTGHPCRDQIGWDGSKVMVSRPSLLWDNTQDGVYFDPDTPRCSSYIAKGRDFCTGASSMPVSCNGVATSYVPFTYPHPLRTDCVKYPSLCDSGSTPPPPPPPPTVPGDLNNDGKVDITDLVIVATNFGRTSGFDVRANVVSSIPEVIDISDLSFVARRFTG